MTILKDSKIMSALTIALSLSSFVVHAQEENGMIRLVNKTHIYCVGEENVDSAMLTVPPLEKVRPAKNLLESGIWENDDWIIHESNHVISTVTDKRWEDFNLTQTNYINFFDLMTSVAFSVYQLEDAVIHAGNEYERDYYTMPFENVRRWNTYNIYLKKNWLNYFKNNVEVRKYSLKNSTKIWVETKQNTYFKVHSYKYKEATNVTNTKNGPTILKIPDVSNSSCIVLYTSLCKSCVLEVEYDGHRDYINSKIEEMGDFEKWQIYKIYLNSSTTSEVNFIRKKNNQTEDGYWRLDVRLYDDGCNVAAFDIHSSTNPEKIQCKYLQPSDIAEQNRPKRNVNPPKSFMDTNCPLGMVGTNCDISCSRVLGQQYPHCEGHKICNSTNCGCVKGYAGPWCEQSIFTTVEVDEGNQCQEYNEDYTENIKEGTLLWWMICSNIISWTVLLGQNIILLGKRVRAWWTKADAPLLLI